VFWGVLGVSTDFVAQQDARLVGQVAQDVLGGCGLSIRVLRMNPNPVGADAAEIQGITRIRPINRHRLPPPPRRQMFVCCERAQL
jgi:hypothetical protein